MNEKLERDSCPWNKYENKTFIKILATLLNIETLTISVTLAIEEYEHTTLAENRGNNS